MENEFMFLHPFEINQEIPVSDIVNLDFRTAEVFRKHGIPYCCGAKWPINLACEMHGVKLEHLQKELEYATRTLNISNVVDFSQWDTNFLLDYIVNIHHFYLKQTLPQVKITLHDFVGEHVKKYPYLEEVERKFIQLQAELTQAVRSEEEILFPYIRQLVHAHKHKEPYAALFIRTLRKPVEDLLYKSQGNINTIVMDIRALTGSYTPPQNACTSHKVVMSKLKELDNDLMQHFYLEKSILFPRAIMMEKEVLNIKTA